ncbi:MAG: hypothetical protein PHO91_01505 [Patescibacteria group bacterium]|nr:hypothetical protein [Patescibacteria group bacterium]
MKKVVLIIIAIFALLLVSGCAGTNSVQNTPGSNGVAGFWSGLWHGMIAPISWLISLFNSNVNIYEVHNNGGWYDFGFVLGAGILARGSRSSRRREH